MPKFLDPSEPVIASHRFIRAILNSLYHGEVVHIPKEYDRIDQVFRKMGGTWKGIFNGNIKEICQLKDVVNFAYEKGYLTRKEKWSEAPSDERRKVQ